MKAVTIWMKLLNMKKKEGENKEIVDQEEETSKAQIGFDEGDNDKRMPLRGHQWSTRPK